MSVEVLTQGGGASLQSRSVSLTSTSATTFSPQSGYNGMSSITVTPNLQTKSVTPASYSQSVSPSSGYCGLESVSVSGDSNLISSNIKSRVTIFGVTGNLVSRGNLKAVVGQYNREGYSSSSQSFTFDTSDSNLYDESQIVGILIYPEYAENYSSGYAIHGYLYLKVNRHTTGSYRKGFPMVQYDSADTIALGDFREMSITVSNGAVTVYLPVSNGSGESIGIDWDNQMWLIVYSI